MCVSAAAALLELQRWSIEVWFSAEGQAQRVFFSLSCIILLSWHQGNTGFSTKDKRGLITFEIGIEQNSKY